MIKSMTAHSRCSLTTSWGVLFVEMHSINRRHLEINCALPKEFGSFDLKIKKQIQKHIFRGKVHLYLNFELNGEQEVFALKPNVALAKEIQKGWEVLCGDLNIQAQDGLLNVLTQNTNLLKAEFKESFVNDAESEIGKLVKASIDELVAMRKQEGEFLKKELLNCLKILKSLLKQVIENTENAAKERQKKLKDRISELLEEDLAKDERMLKEIAYLADKSDTTEEIARIQSHIDLFEKTIETEKQSHGKTLDFIAQELNREWNTIGAKCSDSQTTHLVIQAKGECEKIREQVQNVE